MRRREVRPSSHTRGLSERSRFSSRCRRMASPPMAPGLKPGRLFGGTNMVAAVTQAAKNPQAAFDFIAWQAGSVGQRETWVNRSLFLPSRKDIPIPHMPSEQYRRMKLYFYRALPRAIDREPLYAEVK